MPETTKQVCRVTIDASIEDVWATLTQEGEVLPFFFGSVLHSQGMRPGARYAMRSPDGKFTGVVGEILEYDPPHRYVTTFRFTAYDDPPCKVTHELREVEGGVEYTLTSEQIPVNTKTERDMKQGGDFIVKTLKSVVETGKPPLKSRFILTMISLFSWTNPKRCRSEHWPLEDDGHSPGPA